MRIIVVGAGAVRLACTYRLAPLISFRQRDKVAGMVEDARQAGANVLRGGRIPDGQLGRAACYEHTLITDAAQAPPSSSRRSSAPSWSACPSTATTTRFGSPTTPRTGRPRPPGPPTSSAPAARAGRSRRAVSGSTTTNIRHVISDITGDQRKGWHDTVFTSP